MVLREPCKSVPDTRGRAMQIGRDELLAGVPAKRLRDALIKMGGDSWSRKKLREELKLPPRLESGPASWRCSRPMATSKRRIARRDGMARRRLGW